MLLGAPSHTPSLFVLGALNQRKILGKGYMVFTQFVIEVSVTVMQFVSVLRQRYPLSKSAVGTVILSVLGLGI